MRCQVLGARRVKRAGILGASQTSQAGGRGKAPGGWPFIRPEFLCMCGPIVKGKKGEERERRAKGGERGRGDGWGCQVGGKN